MAQIVRAGYVSDVKCYVNGLIKTEVESIADAVKVTAQFVDGLKKGWHVESVNVDNDGNVTIDVKKTD